MDDFLAYLSILILVVVGAIVCFWWLSFNDMLGDAYYWINLWNGWISSIRDEQNQKCDLGLPHSMQYAKTCNHTGARRLEKLISANHEQILDEVWGLIGKGYQGLSMADLDHAQRVAFGSQRGWKPIWVKFIDQWAGTAKELPTLKKIVEEMGDDVLLLHVSVFWPPVQLVPHRGVSKGVYRYHYGLEIPEGDTGMLINNQPFRWQKGVGVIWDDTLMHSAWNRTLAPRLVIFADLPRELPLFLDSLNRRVHKFIQQTKHIQEIQEKLARQGIQVD